MAHFPWPFYRPVARHAWYVEIDKRQVLLGKLPIDAPIPTKKGGKWDPPRDILTEYHRVMASFGDRKRVNTSSQFRGGVVTVAEVLDEFLGWLRQQQHKAIRTKRWYEKYLQSFLDSLEDQLLLFEHLEPRHVTRWLGLHPGWGNGQRGAITVLQRAMNWSAKEGLLKSLGRRSPLNGMEKPPQGRREQLISRSDFAELLSCVKDNAFHDLLTAAWHTGCRPHELFTVTTDDADPDRGLWVFPLRESKGKRVRRVVYLDDKMVELTRRLLVRQRSGPLLLNSDGNAWTQSATKCRFQRLRLVLGRKRLQEKGLLPPKIRRLTAMERQDPEKVRHHRELLRIRKEVLHRLTREHGTRYSLYSMRHSACTRMLADAKLDAVTVATLLGHRDTTMIARHYAHLAQRPDHLRDAANRSSGA